ncbi:branched-chain amino acid transport system II carrier protein [Enterococcus viikkiensis]|uniref:branched-chain amino acid transport system II carrier protein n=1 Tax=Enterococcus viikkiensis TaxID=930854 RepID=UPI0010F47D4C|nr:branched-chain amino acid transport system II carrier protein [Enterococcus viikkiensis]
MQALTHHYFNKESFVYQITMGFTVVPAVLDMLANAPKVVASQPVVASLLQLYHSYVPFAALGLGWVLPTLIGFTCGVIYVKAVPRVVLDSK